MRWRRAGWRGASGLLRRRMAGRSVSSGTAFSMLPFQCYFFNTAFSTPSPPIPPLSLHLSSFFFPFLWFCVCMCVRAGHVCVHVYAGRCMHVCACACTCVCRYENMQVCNVHASYYICHIIILCMSHHHTIYVASSYYENMQVCNVHAYVRAHNMCMHTRTCAYMYTHVYAYMYEQGGHHALANSQHATVRGLLRTCAASCATSTRRPPPCPRKV